jgi:RND superfamily putative drug exporter
VPVFLFAIVFGLSMDYEVLLVSRVHEEWEQSGSAAKAVQRGLALIGRVITAAAIIMTSVFAGFLLGDNRIIKTIGLGLAAAILFRRLRDPAGARAGNHVPAGRDRMVDA